MKRSVLLSSFLVAAVLTPMLLQTNYCNLEKYQKLATLELYVPDINGQNVISDFDPDGILYKVELPLDPPDTAVLLVQAQDATATIEVTYDSLPISLGPNGVAPLTLAPDHSEIKVAVRGDNMAWTYTVSIDRVDYCPCDDGNACTYDICMPADQVCVYRAVPDGTLCEGIRGGCYGGVCNFVPVSVAIGPKEVVFDWTTDRCEEFDIPDGPAKVVRAENQELVLFATHETGNYLSRGSDFDNLERDCEHSPLQSANLPTPESYENNEWLWAPYREGSAWHVLIHNEFHDPTAPPPCSGVPFGNRCWYNSITYAVSTDSARSFVKPSPPNHVVAPAPEVWAPPPPDAPSQDWYAEGYFAPSNIVRGPDDYYYALFQAIPHWESGHQLACVMRTNTLGDPSSWRAWDGMGFNLPLTSPYVTGEPSPVCSDLGAPTNTSSLTYNTYVGRYMFVAPLQGAEGCGIYFTLSSDLLHWSHLQLIVKASITWCQTDPQTPGLLDALPILYPSIVDHSDSTTNFERPGRTPYLYYTRHNPAYWLDRDLVRVPLTFTIGGPLCDGVDCDDQNECTEDLCNGADGSCEHTPIECADSNDCTIDTCNPTIGCEHADAANGTPCGGGAGVCQEGSCAAQFPCSEQGIRDAIAFGGGPHTFDCATPTTVATTAEIVIDNDVVLDGGGNLTVDGNGDHRVFSVAVGVNAELMDLTVTGGSGSDVGGGILNGGTLSLTDVIISGNTAANIGGGLSSQPGAVTTLFRATIEDNNVTSGSGGGLGNDGTMTLIDTTVRGNRVRWHGGGIFQNGSMALINSTVSGNTAVYGGAIWNLGGSLALTNSTVSSNVATDAGGGGIVNEANLTLVSTTLAGNSATQIGTAIWNSGTVSLRNTIVAGDCEIVAPLSSLGGNIESEGNTCGLGHPTDQVSVPTPLLLLGPLQDNGGPTMTHALLPGSEAIDWIPEAMCIDAEGQPLTTDQRGQLRPAGPGCDVGSFEAQP